jgi:hypothetical protein
MSQRVALSKKVDDNTGSNMFEVSIFVGRVANIETVTVLLRT